jgi:hypothetical protein
MKLCTKCGECKDLSLFHKDKTHADGYRSFCKACVGLYMRKNYEKNKDKIKAKVYAWIENNRERHNEKCKRWVKNNRASVNARTARRYASKTQATPAWLTPDDHWMIQEAYALAKLRTQMLGGHWEVDHIVPLRGRTAMGLHVPWNLQVIRRSENRRKSNGVSV